MKDKSKTQTTTDAPPNQVLVAQKEPYAPPKVNFVPLKMEERLGSCESCGQASF
jgi:hypothetical protein